MTLPTRILGVRRLRSHAFGSWRFRAALLTPGLLLCVLLGASGWAQPPNVADESDSGTLELHYVGIEGSGASVLVAPGGGVVGFDTAERGESCDRLIAFYELLGVEQLDYLVISHYAPRTIGCVPELLDRFPLRERVIDRGGAGRGPVFKRYRNAVAGRRQKARPGDVFELEPRPGRPRASGSEPVVLEVLAARGRVEGDRVRLPRGNESDRSAVVMVRMGEFDAIFGGAIAGQRRARRRDVESLVAPVAGRVEVYTAHDQGSALSSSAAWLDATRPLVAMLPVDETGPAGRPARAVTGRLHDVLRRTFWTSRGNGARPRRVRGDRVCGTLLVEVEPGSEAFTVNCRGKVTSFDVHPPSVPPDAPRNLDASVEGSAVTLSWDAPSRREANEVSYLVEVGTASGSADVASRTTSATSLTVGGLRPGTYFARVTARNEFGSSPASDDVRFEIETANADTPPGQPRNLSATVSGSDVRLSWDAPASGGLPGRYTVRIGTARGSSDVAVSETEETSLTVEELAPGTYFTRVRASNRAGTGPATDEVEFEITDANGGDSPGRPENLTAAVSGSSVLLSWDAPATGGTPDEYTVRVGTGPGLSNVAVETTGQATLELTDLDPGTYFARVRASNEFGTGAATDDVQFEIEQTPGADITMVLFLVPETVIIFNEGDEDIPMGGWKLVSVVGGETFTFPEDFVLRAGAEVQITSGERAISNPPEALIGWEEEVWEDDGDTAQLFDEDGQLVATAVGELF